MLLKFAVLSVAVFAVGYVLTYLLFRRRGQRLRGSALETKIFMWIPLFFVALAFAYGNVWLQLGLLALAFWQVNLDLIGAGGRLPVLSGIYAAGVEVGLFSLFAVADAASPQVFLALWFMSVLSDVAAFFAGSYAGRHKLPAILNNQKSWEGVAGQFVGAALAFGLLGLAGWDVPAYFILTVGVGSALGDLANSYVKRRLGIKEWSNRIPGHGGYLDRFASLAGASLLTLLAIWL